MGKGKAPSIQWYIGDWRKDPAVQALSFHDRGVWFEILMLMAESDQPGLLTLNGKAMPEDALARLLGLDKQNLTKTLTTLIEYGVASRDEQTGALMNRRMVRDQNLRAIRQKSGQKGGNPALLNQSDKPPVKPPVNQVVNQNGNQNPTPSSSSSPSGEEKENKKKKKAGPPSLDEAKAYAVYLGMPESEGERFVHYFKSVGWVVGQKRAPMKDWKAAMVTWRENWKKRGGQSNGKPTGDGLPDSANQLHMLRQQKQKELNDIEAEIDELKRYGEDGHKYREREQKRADSVREELSKIDHKLGRA